MDPTPGDADREAAHLSPDDKATLANFLAACRAPDSGIIGILSPIRFRDLARIIEATVASARAAGAREEGNRRYNAGLDTAMRLVRECGGELVETLIAGLECSKYPIMVAKPDPTTPKEARDGR